MDRRGQFHLVVFACIDTGSFSSTIFAWIDAGSFYLVVFAWIDEGNCFSCFCLARRGQFYLVDFQTGLTFVFRSRCWVTF